MQNVGLQGLRRKGRVMLQPDLFSQPSYVGRARHTDPQPSKVAAVKADQFAGSHADRILVALRTHGPRSAHELEHLIGLSVVQIDRRVAEMRRAGLLEVHADAGGTPVTRKTPTGGESTVLGAR